MKKVLLVTMVIIAFTGLLFLRVSADNSNDTKKGAFMADKKILIAYYSYSGNTKSVAERIQKQTGGDLFEIQTVNAYPADYNAVVQQAKQEKEKDYRPALKSKAENINEYDIVFLGTPIWWYTMAPAVKSFIAENNLAGKTVVPFCTHGGGGVSSAFSDIAKLAPNSKVLKGLVVYENGSSSTDKEISEWLKELN